jgi:hypothetical protein
VKYKSDLRRDGNDYLSKNAEQEVMMKLGLDYQKDDTTTSVSYERIQQHPELVNPHGKQYWQKIHCCCLDQRCC